MTTSVLAHADDFIHARGTFEPKRRGVRRWWHMVLMVVAFGAIYGAAMGTFVVDKPERLWQLLFGALKVPLLLLTTTILCLPAFVVVNTIAGLRDDLREAVQALLAGQAALSVALASLAPVIHTWYWCESSYRAALIFNACLFALATIAGHRAIRRYYGELIRRNSRHRAMLVGWFALYAFVGVQMGWIMRPFVGDPTRPVTFFRDGAFSNAYVVVFQLFFGH